MFDIFNSIIRVRGELSRQNLPYQLFYTPRKNGSISIYHCFFFFFLLQISSPMLCLTKFINPLFMKTLATCVYFAIIILTN